MKIFLKKLELKNFKGIKSKKIDFAEKTIISGKNESGKTTIFNAYMWLLWGKDSKNRKDYEIKPYEDNGENKHNLEYSVEGLIDVDGEEINLKRVYKEKWTKKRGSNTEDFTGNTTEFYINEVPKKLSEYNSFVEKIIKEDEFNLLSNPLYFNEHLDYKERRDILINLVEDVTKDDVFAINSKLKELELDKYTLEEIQAMAKHSAKKIKKDIEEIPSRIDELESMKTDDNFKEIEKEKSNLEKEIDKIDEVLADSSKVTSLIKEKSSRVNELEKEKRLIISNWEDENKKRKNEIEDRKREFKRKIDTAEFEISNHKDIYSKKLKAIQDKEKDIKDLEEEIIELRNDWKNTNKETIKDDFTCPTCGQDLPSDQVEEIKAKFNLDKSEKLEKITKKAKEKQETINDVKKDIENSKKELDDLKISAEKLNAGIEEFKKQLDEIKDYVEKEKPKELEKIDEEIKAIEVELKNLSENENSDLILNKKELSKQLDLLIKKLANKDLNKSIEEKIKAYEEQEDDFKKKFETQERILDLCDEYTKTYVNLVSEKINSLFEFAEFKLFETQINGGIKETADATYKGVPYGTLNNATTYNVGLDIINALSKKFDKYIPIFVDNAESVNKLLEVDSQLVELRVSEDKELVIKGE